MSIYLQQTRVVHHTYEYTVCTVGVFARARTQRSVQQTKPLSSAAKCLIPNDERLTLTWVYPEELVLRSRIDVNSYMWIPDALRLNSLLVFSPVSQTHEPIFHS